MKDVREEWFDAGRRVAVAVVDVTGVAQALARSHLCGPTAAHYLARGLAAAALLGAETSDPEESVVVQERFSGPLGGLNVECTAAGALRGYTEKKILDDFDGLGRPKDSQVLGDRRVQVTRSVPGRILSQGVAASLGEYLSESLQRRAVIATEASVSDDVEVLLARGVMIEAMPDAPDDSALRVRLGSLAMSSRTLLRKLGLEKAELRRTTPLVFACRCSPERAAATLAALTDDERAAMPPAVDVTCHMCGKTYSVAVPRK